MLITALMIQKTILVFNPFFISYNEGFGIGPVFYLPNRKKKNICFNKVANCNRQSHFIVLYGAAIWFFIQVISFFVHCIFFMLLILLIVYCMVPIGNWLALQLLLSAPHQLRWSWKWRNFLWLFISFWWCRNPAFYYHSQN